MGIPVRYGPQGVITISLSCVSVIATTSVSRLVAHPMIMLLEQDQMMRSCRLHLTVAFGLLEPLLRLSILFRAQLNIP